MVAKRIAHSQSIISEPPAADSCDLLVARSGPPPTDEISTLRLLVVIFFKNVQWLPSHAVYSKSRDACIGMDCSANKTEMNLLNTLTWTYVEDGEIGKITKIDVEKY